MRALVVEDEKRLAETVRDLLRLDGYLVDISYDGESGLDNALSGIYDVCVLDIMLPKLDGFEVLRRLRREGSGLPVLLLTARSDLADRVRGLDSGADYYLAKPFEPKELLACIRALTRRQPEIRETDVIAYGDLELNKNGFLLRCGGRERIRINGIINAQPGTGIGQRNDVIKSLGIRVRRGGKQRGSVYFFPAAETGAFALRRAY